MPLVKNITDTRFTIETPEGADLPMHPAGIGARMMAYGIDFLIKIALIISVIIVLSMIDASAFAGIMMIAVFLIFWFYPVLFELFLDGQSPGKKAYGLRVVSEDGTPLTFASSLLRNLLRFVDALPIVYLAGLVTCMSNRRFQRIGDLVAGTMVVYVAEPITVPQINVQGTRALPDALSTEEQRSIVNFAERSQWLSPARQKELADILSPFLEGGDSVLHLKQMAKNIVESGDKVETTNDLKKSRRQG
jgi:uncharacterized RDD family membrane protein YckC